MLQDNHQQSTGNWVAALRGFLGSDEAVLEHCELCNAEIPSTHAHLVEPESRRMLCACQGCALLFDSQEAVRYRRVQRDVAPLPDFMVTDAQWEAFLIPINLAFFFRSSAHERVLAMYPGPAGATESTLDLEAWNDLEAANPTLAQLQPDIEALLVNRVLGAREYYRVPIDRCYELVGLIRNKWHGISGGDDVRETIEAFFDSLREQAQPAETAHA